MTRAILTPDEMKAAELAVIEAGTDSFELMKTAGEAVADQLHDRFPDGRVQVLCGPGGNGGDGFVAAARLKKLGREVEVFLLGAKNDLSGDPEKAAKLWGGKVHSLEKAQTARCDIVLDALFGGGLSRPLDGIAADLSDRPLPTVSIDVPSGINGAQSQVPGPHVRADLTVTFAAYRPAHLLAPASGHCGDVEVADIGVLASRRSCLNGPADWKHLLPGPDEAAHKHARGHLGVVSGGASSTGAARLAAMAGLRSGAGLVTLLSPPAAVIVNASHVTAIMVQAFNEPAHLKAFAERAGATIIGPAAGIGETTRRNTLALLRQSAPVIIDADAITSFSGIPAANLFNALRPIDVLTPHIGEFARLFPLVAEGPGNKIDKAREAAAKAGGIILLKGPDTVIAAPDGRVVVSRHATPWLATAGSGDVLAGIIGGLIAGGMESFEAACAAAWVHGEAGIRCGPYLIAEDLPPALPEVLAQLANHR